MEQIVNLTRAYWGAFNFLAMFGILCLVLYDRGIGHRKIIFTFARFMGLQAIASSVFAYHVYNHEHYTVVSGGIGLLICAVGSECVFRGAFQIGNIMRTLRESQKADLIRKDEPNDRLQANMQNSFLLQTAVDGQRAHMTRMERLLSGA